MKTFILFVLTALSTIAQAQSGSLFPDYEREISYKQFYEAGCGLVHNGSCSSSSYDTEAFNYSQTLRDLHADNEEHGVLLKWDDIQSELSYLGYLNDSAFLEQLHQLRTEREIKAMFLVVPPEDCTESESCSYSSLYIYLQGVMYYFNFDYTT